MTAVNEAAACQGVRFTDSGLSAVWDASGGLWRHYRMNWRTNTNEAAGSTLEFQP